jgi:hypothetical protein
MPYELIKIPKKPFYKVRNVESGKVKAKKTTKENAEKQIRLLNTIEKKGY